MTDSIDQRLKIIEEMLTAILRSQNNIHWIGGYVYGKTKGGDPFVILYPAAEYLNEKAVRVYPTEFKRLPSFIPTANIQGKTKGNPSKSEAHDLGIYNECPMFQVLTYEGKDTPLGKERRFYKTIRVTDKMPGGRALTSSAKQPDDEPDENLAPVAPVAPATPKRQLTLPEIKHHQQEARTADDEFMFITAVNKLHPANTHDGLVVIRGRICNDKLTRLNAAAQLEAIEKYLARRKELEREGKSATQSHQSAITDAAALYARLRGETQ